MPAKSSQLQIRVTPRQKALLKRRATLAGMDLSAYVLARALPDEPARFGALLRELGDHEQSRFALAALSDFLDSCPPSAFADAVADANVARLTPRLANYVAAMVEVAAQRKRVPPPAWTLEVAPLEAPWFATSLKSLRLHLLVAAPVPFKRRNLFVDSSVGDRV